MLISRLGVLRAEAMCCALLLVVSACGGSESDGRAGSSGGVGVAGSTAGASGSGAGTGASGTGAAGDGTAGTTTADAGNEFDAGSEPDRNSVEAGMLCERMTTIQCAGEQHCCPTIARDFAACKLETMMNCRDTVHLDEIAQRPITMFDKAHAKVAFEEFERLASECDPNIAKWGITSDGLRGFLKGTKGPGASCLADSPINDAVNAGSALASCTDSDSQSCLPTLVAGWTCEPLAAVGGSCFTDANCTGGLYCDNPNLGFTATCKTRKASGLGCTNDNECESLACVLGFCADASASAAFCLRKQQQ